MKSNGEKTFTIQPVAGPLDLTSSPDAVPFGGYRWVENFETNPQDKKMRRMTGYQRFLPGLDYENADLHFRYGFARQHITFAFEARTPIGFTKLFAGTQNQLFAKNNSNQTWQPIWSGFGGEPNINGCSEVILQAANVNSTVLFSNDFDDPVYHVIDQPSNGDGTYVQPIPDFQTLKISRVGFLYAWNNLVIAANVVIDGVRQTNLVLWSDYKKPLSFVPNKNSSLAGRKFLAYGEIVLNAAELADALMLYTNRGVWEIRVSDAVDGDGNAVVLSFTKRYTPDKSGSRCLKFKRTLVSDGDNHYYAGEDGIYRYNFYVARPEIEEWSRRAASHLFIKNTLNKSRCATHCAGYDTAKKAYYFSYALAGDTCNSETLVMNTETHFSSVIREGCSFFLNHNPRTLKSLRQWMFEHCICPADRLASIDKCIADVVSNCEGEVCTTMPLAGYAGYKQWDIRNAGGGIDLLGEGSAGDTLNDYVPGNGLYLGIGNTNGISLMSTKHAFLLATGSTYRLSIRVAGNNQGHPDVGPTLHIGMDNGVDLSPALNPAVTPTQGFTDYTLDISGDGTSNKKITIYVEGPGTSPMPNMYLVKSVKLERLELGEDDYGLIFNEDWLHENETCVGSDVQPARYTSDANAELHSVTAEDWNATPTEDSLRSILAGVTVQELCGGEFTSDECSTGTLFIFGSTLDRCIKQLSDVLFRERCVGFEKCGTYENRGYLSIVRSGPISLQAPTDDKTWTRFNVEAEPDVAMVPGRMSFRLGVAATALDPNQVNCPIYWEVLMDPMTGEPFKMKCLSDSTEQQHEDEGTKPDSRYEWPMHHTGKYHYFELTIHNQDSTPVDVGAGVAVSRMEFDARVE